jgi:diguanylate cyclase (GGDEF)-like protein
MNKYIIRGKYISISIWLVLICLSAGWNMLQAEQAHRQLQLETARSFFMLIVTTREWNSQMGGVYVPVTEKVQPNPYLEDPNRDIVLPSGQILTKINPAYMTRMLAELAHDKSATQFHITSLNPIRPANAALDWEVIALTSFEKDRAMEYIQYTPEAFYYMAPLITQQSCLACHAKQGYQVGDVRGGISITMRTQPVQNGPLLISHLLIGLAGAGLLLLFHMRLGRAVEQLERQSGLDGLTQLHNRSYFDLHFSREYGRSKRQKSPLSILMCDVDCFKAYNDTFGHQNGDQALKNIAGAITRSLKRPADLAARYGGEEFVVLLPDTTTQGARAVAELVRVEVECLGMAHPQNKAGPLVTISIGCCTYLGGQSSMEELLRKADAALYQAKNSGRNQVCSTPDLQAGSKE